MQKGAENRHGISGERLLPDKTGFHSSRFSFAKFASSFSQKNTGPGCPCRSPRERRATGSMHLHPCAPPFHLSSPLLSCLCPPLHSYLACLLAPSRSAPRRAVPVIPRSWRSGRSRSDESKLASSLVCSISRDRIKRFRAIDGSNNRGFRGLGNGFFWGSLAREQGFKGD